MSTIRTAIQIQDSMTPAFRSMNNALNIVISSFENLNNASSSAVDTASIQAARKELINAEVVFNEVEESIRRSNLEQQQFNNNLKNGHTVADNLLNKIKRFAGAYVGMQAVKGIMDTSDELVQTKARIDMMNDGLQTTEQLQQMIFESAQRARASYAGTANAVAQLGIRAKDTFANNTEVVAFSEILNKMFKIAGASQQEMSSATLQLTQALGSGVLRGEEFNAVFEAAPNVMQAVADYIGRPIGELKTLASEGEISADIVKNAMFAAADETNAKFESMPMTIGEIWTNIKNRALKAFQPVLLKINEIANNPNFNIMVTNMCNGFATISNIALGLLEVIANISGFFSDNWSIIEPIVIGIASALTVYTAALIAHNVVQGIHSMLEGISALKVSAHAASLSMQAGATFSATVAQYGFNAALLACPLTWIIIIILGVIMALTAWSIKTNGLKATWLIFTDKVLTCFEYLKLGAYQMAYGFMDAFDYIQIGIKMASVGVQTGLNNMKVMGLKIVESFVNGCIDSINWLIDKANKIPGVSIDTLSHVTFAAEAQAKADLENKAKFDELNNYTNEKKANIDERRNALKSMANEMLIKQRERDADIQKAKLDHENGVDDNPVDKIKDFFDNSNFGKGIEETAGNTAAIKDNLDITEEDLRYLRDLAEQEVVNRFTTAEVKVDMGGINNNVNSNVDLDGMVAYLEETLTETMASCAEGVHV